MNQINFTHKGWFGFCPVYIGDIESEAPFIHERHWTLSPLMFLSEMMFELIFVFLPEENRAWPIRITGTLDG